MPSSSYAIHQVQHRWSERTLPGLAARPFVMEPVGTTARDWALTICRHAGFEPDVRYTSTDLQIHLRLAENGLAAALLPDLSDAPDSQKIVATRLPGRPRRQLFIAVRRGAASHPNIHIFTNALERAS